VSILAESDEIKQLLQSNGIDSETLEDVHPIRVQPSRVLSHIYARLGELRVEGMFNTHTKNTGLLTFFVFPNVCEIKGVF